MQRLLRFTLDLFEREPVPVPSVPDTAPVPPVQRAAPPALPPQTLEHPSSTVNRVSH